MRLIKKANDHSNSNESVPFNILTLSGGGTRGAFGAGLLSGWTDSGDIPEFDIVTGVSTGAVMATFAFLGGDELEKVKTFYTKMYTEDIYTNSWLSFFGQAYLMNPAPLKKLFSNNFNEALLKRVADCACKGPTPLHWNNQYRYRAADCMGYGSYCSQAAEVINIKDFPTSSMLPVLCRSSYLPNI